MSEPKKPGNGSVAWAAVAVIALLALYFLSEGPLFGACCRGGIPELITDRLNAFYYPARWVCGGEGMLYEFRLWHIRLYIPQELVDIVAP